jgi:glycoside/pentoside/hexuronide:cation symporter, GPH family
VPTAPHQTTRPEDRVSLREKIGLGFGKIAADGTGGTLHVLVNPIYNITLGLNPALISTVVFIQRLWDAMLDPLWGQFSDNFRSRWGRRLPLMAAAAVPLGLLFGMLWWFPREASQTYLFVHLLLVSLAFYAAHSLFMMPLQALIVEATDDYHERSRLAGFTIAFSWAFQIAAQWLFPLTQIAYFGDGITGLRWVAGACAVFFVFAGLLPVFLCKERHYARVAVRQPKAPFLPSLRQACQHRPFMLLLSCRFLTSFCYNAVGMLGIYMNMYYIFGGDLKRAAIAYGFLGTSFQVTATLCSLFAYPWLAQRYGKKRTLQVAASILIIGCLSKIVLYQPDHPWLQLIVLACNGAAQAGFFLMATAMLGDIADYAEWKSGLRQEALFASLLTWFEKAGNSLGSFLAGFVLVWIGFNAKTGAQTPETLALMKAAYVIAPAIGGVFTLWLIHYYDLSEAKSYEIKTELARRRAASHSPATGPA